MTQQEIENKFRELSRNSKQTDMPDSIERDYGPKDEKCCMALREPTAQEIIDKHTKEADVFLHDMQILRNMLPSKLSYEQNASLIRILSRL